MENNCIQFADEKPVDNMVHVKKCFDYILVEIEKARDEMQYKELAPHDVLDLFSRLRLKINSGIEYARMELTKRELSRLGYTDEQIQEMSCI